MTSCTCSSSVTVFIHNLDLLVMNASEFGPNEMNNQIEAAAVSCMNCMHSADRVRYRVIWRDQTSRGQKHDL